MNPGRNSIKSVILLNLSYCKKKQTKKLIISCKLKLSGRKNVSNKLPKCVTAYILK